MKEKYKNILQIVIVFILIICALIFNVIPEYKASQGSSDKYIDTENYTDIVEVKVNNKPNFALIITDNQISNILFFDQESLCLYNQNIEGTSIKDGTNKIIELLITNDYLKQDYFLILTKYKNKSYEKTKQYLLTALQDLSVTVNVQEESSSIEQKAKENNITYKDEISSLKEIELLSKDIVRQHNNDVSYQSTINKPENITQDNSREYTDTVYKKIESYMRSNNITNQTIDNQTLEITKIPANSRGNVFPDSTSWYYIEDSKVYAYISITINNNNYSYCYQASIDVYKKGQC
ncbi:MAG: hypothetical protein IJE53_00475 [Bacilli bacterium]|nr:hypothetical protein [Bacilli bacterium]